MMPAIGSKLTKALVAGFVLATGFLTLVGNAHAARVVVMPGALAEAIAKAATGDVLVLKPGVYAGPLVIEKSLTLAGENGRVEIKGNGRGSVITLKAVDIGLRGLTVTGSGLSLASQDSGIFISREARNAQVIGNTVHNNLIGVYVWGAHNARIKGNTITGRRDLRMNERGNGVQIWNAPGTVIEDNTVRYGRDGIFVTTSRNNIFRNNRFTDLRFAVHYMYTDNSVISGNVSRRNHIGYAIMFSTSIEVRANLSENDRDRGMLFNYANKVTIIGNTVRGGSEKCVFIYNSNKNIFRYNKFSDCRIGVHFTGGSERNEITENAFINNRTQVKYIGTRWLDWSRDGRGNYWSDHGAFDLNGDGIADAAYRPNDLTDHILWRYPVAKLLANSPAVQILKWAQSAFPALHPGGVIDTAPLMSFSRPAAPISRTGS